MSILDRLRAATHDAHVALEEQLGLPSRVTTVDAYIRLLGRFWGIYQPLESCMSNSPAWPSVAALLAPRLKSRAIQLDLRHFGCDVQHLPLCGKLPDVSSAARLLGCAYVLEGATLGGQVITRGLRRVGVDAGQGVAFFNSYGRDVGPMWKQFRAMFEEQLHDDALQQQAADAAQATFAAFLAWFSECEGAYDDSRAAGRSDQLR